MVGKSPEPLFPLHAVEDIDVPIAIENMLCDHMTEEEVWEFDLWRYWGSPL